MAVHQLLSYARRGDAVTNQALALHEVLGSGSLLVAHAFDDSVDDDVVALAGLDPDAVGADDLVLYHVTIGCEPAAAWLQHRPGPFGLVYHNITPSRFFEGLSHDHARLTAQGRDELAQLVPGAAVIIADSEFNGAEIEALGGTVDAIQPPIATTRRLAAIPDDPKLARALDERDLPDLVSIGQIAPHKRPHELLFAHHLLVTHLDADATLTLIGATPVPAYDDVLSRTIELLALHQAKMLGPVSDTELATRLRRARALVTMSVHEGFCVPVVEAMAAGVPVVACAAGAIPETAGGAALLLPPDAAPSTVAEAFRAVITDDALAADLRARGLARAAELEQRTDPARLLPLLSAHR